MFSPRSQKVLSLNLFYNNLRFNSHLIQFTFKVYNAVIFFYYIQSCATIITINCTIFSSPQKGTPNSYWSLPLTPSPK